MICTKMTSPSHKLSIQSFVKAYNQERILAIDSLNLEVGIYFIRGGIGTGKTTLFKCLAGISPCEGQISIDGIRLNENPVKYRYLVNFAEAEPVYPAFLTARDLMLFVGKTKNASPTQIDFLVESMGLGWFYEKSCGTYSSGMLKKLSLALAFLGDPSVIVLDEPLITLDEDSRESLLRVIDEKKETLFLVSSHQSLEGMFPRITRSFKIQNKTLVPFSDH